MLSTLEHKVRHLFARQVSVTASDPTLAAVLAKPDDHLLKDAGLSRCHLMGVEGCFWLEWRRNRTPWDL